MTMFETSTKLAGKTTENARSRVEHRPLLQNNVE